MAKKSSDVSTWANKRGEKPKLPSIIGTESPSLPPLPGVREHAAAYAASDRANASGKASDHKAAAAAHTLAADYMRSGARARRDHLATAANHEKAAREGAKAVETKGDDRPRDDHGRFASK